MTYYILDAFTDQPFGGNPAGVVLLESEQFPEERLMLQIAAELRYSETAFIRRHSDKEFTIRYFTPKAEVELCGHATIASFYLLHHEGLASRTCLCHTLAGDLRIEAGERVMMQMAMPRIVATVEQTAEIYKALGVNDYHPIMPIQIAYSGLPDLMIPLPDVETLQALNPDMEAIAAITKKYICNITDALAQKQNVPSCKARLWGGLQWWPHKSEWMVPFMWAARRRLWQKVNCVFSLCRN